MKYLFFLFISCVAFSQNKTFYLEGNIGKAKIFLTIEENDSDVIASYFYQNSLKDILFEGTRKNTFYTFAFKDSSDKKIFEKFELTRLTNGSFKGSWINSKNKKTPITLKPIIFSNYLNSTNLDLQNKMDKVKLNFLQFKQDSISIYKGKKFLWYSEKHCQSSFFRLGDNFSSKEINTVNPILDKIHLQNTLSQLNCSSRFEYSNGDGIEYTTSISFLNSNLLGFKVFSSWFCGGAHPDFGGDGYLIDLNNGKDYEIDEIIAFDKSVTTEKKGGFDAYLQYRSDFFAPKLFELINESEKFKKPKNEDEGCDYTEIEIWDFVSWNYTEKGIEFTPHFPRVIRSCEESFLIPFSKLEKFKAPDFKYPFK